MNTDKTSFEEYYKSIGKVYCPYFKEYIHFTDAGLKHIRFKNEHTVRTSKDRETRIRLVPIAVEIIGASHTLQDKTWQKRFEYRYVNSRKELALTGVTCYEFLAIIKDLKAKVVIKQIENNKKIFLSVIPLFKQKMPLEQSDIL